MKRNICHLLIGLLFLTACGGKPVPPWRSASVSYLDAYQTAFLRGDDHIAAVYFRKARQEIKTSGNMVLLARAHLIRAALHAAVLEPLSEQQLQDYLELEALYPNAENRHYFYFITGRFEHLDATRLPAHYQAVARAFQSGDEAAIETRLEALADPLPYLIAMSRQVRRESDIPPAALQRAVDVASEQGWKRAVISYLIEQQKGYKKQGDTDKARQVTRHLQIISQ